MSDLSLWQYLNMKDAIPSGVRSCVNTKASISLRRLLTPVRIIHISDTHFTDNNQLPKGFGLPEVVEYGYQNSTAKATTLKRFLHETQVSLKANIIVCTGDLTSDGDAPGYERWRCFRDDLTADGFTVFVVPGNHDYCDWGLIGDLGARGGKNQEKRDAFIAAANYTDYSNNPAFPHVEEVGNCIFVLLDSMEAQMDGDTGDDCAQGELGAPQRSALNALLAKYQGYRSRGGMVVVALHHNPMIPKAGTGYGWLNDKDEFLAIISNKVDCLLFGHAGPQQLSYDSLDIGDGIRVNPEEMYGIPIINLENLEDMADDQTQFTVSIIDFETNRVEVYSTDGTSDVNYRDGTAPVKGRITPPVCRDRASVFDGVDCAPAVLFQSGDRVTIRVGGGVQTGGVGSTWFRYVRPRVHHLWGTNDDDTHRGTIYIPSFTDGLQPIRDVMDRYGGQERGDEWTVTLIISNIDGYQVNDRYLKLGYQDDNCTDNCYDRHENGEANQCQGVGPAYVRIEIER